MRLAYLCSCLLVLAACGKDEVFTDAAVGDDVLDDADTSIDAEPAPDAIPDGTVHVTTFGRNGSAPGAVVANVEVLVYGLDGTLRDRDQTDTNGEATLDVLSGDTVTAIYDLIADQDVVLTTYVGVKPGDDLRFGDFPQPAGTGATTGTMTLTWPALTGANTVILVTDCGTQYPATSATSATVTQTDTCNGPTFSALLYTYDLSNNVVQWGEVHDVTFANATTAAIPALQAATTFTVDIAGISPEVSTYYLYAYASVGNSLTYVDWPSYAYGTPQAGAMSGSFPWASGVDGASIHENLYRDGNYGYQYGARRLNPGVNTATTPMTPLPWLTDTVLTVVDARLVQWFQFGTAPYDAGIVTLRWSLGTGIIITDGAALGSGSSISYRWDLIIPPGLTALTFPELPEELADFAPPTTANVNTRVQLVDTDAITGFDAARALPEWELRCLDCFDAGAATTPTVRISQTNSGGGKGFARPGKAPRGLQGAQRLR